MANGPKSKGTRYEQYQRPISVKKLNFVNIIPGTDFCLLPFFALSFLQSLPSLPPKTEEMRTIHTGIEYGVRNNCLGGAIMPLRYAQGSAAVPSYQ